jgi:hypothetical protein
VQAGGYVARLCFNFGLLEDEGSVGGQRLEGLDRARLQQQQGRRLAREVARNEVGQKAHASTISR